MATMYRVRNPNNKKIEIHTPQNANDLVQHLGWKLVGRVEDARPADEHDIQKIMDNAAKMPKAVQLSGPDKDDGDDTDAT